MSKNIIKKISMIMASLALVVTLSSINSNSTSANTHHVYNHIHTVHVMKHHNKRAYKHMRIGSIDYYNSKVNSALNREPKNKYYNFGFNDALNAKVNHKLIHNKNYEKGCLQIIALDNYTAPNNRNIPKHLSNNALNDAKIFYNCCILK